MNNVIKVYDVELTAEGPIFIGSGGMIAKKEYALLAREHMVAVMEQNKLYEMLAKRRLDRPYMKFMLSSDRDDVGRWLYKNGVKEQEYLKCAKYKLDYGDAQIDTHSALSIMEFVKDAYGLPYIPGSSLKGMLRTVLLAADLLDNTSKYGSVARQTASPPMERVNRKSYLQKESAKLEEIFYRTLEREGTRPSDAVNDIMSGLIVSDSEPLSLDDLVLCQRIELNTDGKEKKMNVLREAIRPNTKVRFQLSIDTSVCKITKEKIEKAIAEFGSMYYDVFLQKFRVIDRPKADTVWLGGGSGFITKTEVYPLLGEKGGIRKTMEIFKSIRVPDNHKHRDDARLGVSPHICKVTYYKKRRYQMGAGRLAITEKK